MSTPKILVTICCFNHGKYLRESVQSIIDQTYKNLDICIVDDGSDPDQEISSIIDELESKDPRVRSIRLDQNHGKWHCLNEAIRTTAATICTSHDADDISLPDRIDRQLACLIQTDTLHNLCGFIHCWSEEEVTRAREDYRTPPVMKVGGPDDIAKLVMLGYHSPRINHYYTGDFETAGVSAFFYKAIWDMGIRFNPPDQGLRTLLSEDSDFNFRVTSILRKTSVLAETPYCYRRNTSTNKERA